MSRQTHIAYEEGEHSLCHSDIQWPRKVDVLGVEISATTYEEATEVIIEAAQQRSGGAVTCHPVHGLMEAKRDPELARHLSEFNMITPDGQPVRWAMNLLHDTQLRERVYGPELMIRLCREAALKGISVYLYGSTPKVIGRLTDVLRGRFPSMHIVGVESPPFRELTAQEDEAMVDRINSSGAGLCFIGLGSPKQDRFAVAHMNRISAVQVCVGAAFDFHAGTLRMAPRWMQRNGLEWLFRLGVEPRRLWKRYLVSNSTFAAELMLHYLRNEVTRRLKPSQL